MSWLNNILNEIVNKEFDDLSFSDALRHSRERLGLRQCKTAEHLGITINRLKNLETGYFRVMPRKEELQLLADFYKFPIAKLAEKAYNHVKHREKYQPFNAKSNRTYQDCFRSQFERTLGKTTQTLTDAKKSG